MKRKKYEKHVDLPKTFNPEYLKLWRKKTRNPNTRTWTDHSDLPKRDDPEYKKLWRKKQNKQRQREQSWKWKGIIDLTYERYKVTLTEQKGCCRICNQMMTIPQVDHDHKTGIFRGLLCLTCNTGLGHYEKKKDLFENYLNSTLG